MIRKDSQNNIQIWDFLTMCWSKITKFFAFPLFFKILSFHDFGKASIICNQYIFWVSLRWNSIFIFSQGFIFPLSLNDWLIKFKFRKKKMHRLTVNLDIWVKPNQLRQDHGWKSWFPSIVIYPFYEISCFWKDVIACINIFMKFKFLPKCLPIQNSGIIFQSWKSSSNNFLPKSIV